MTFIVTPQLKASVETWVANATSGVTPHHARTDIHIDEFSPILEDSTLWISGGLRLLEVVAQIWPHRGAGYAVCLVIHLDSEKDNVDIGLTFPTIEWNDLLSITPPELIVYTDEKLQTVVVPYLREYGRVLRTMQIGDSPATVYFTGRAYLDVDELYYDRRIWVILNSADESTL